MKVKTSITLSPETLKEIDREAGKKSNRSRVIETAVVHYLWEKRKKKRDERETEILNRMAKSESVRKEFEDILSYQVDIFEEG